MSSDTNGTAAPGLLFNTASLADRRAADVEQRIATWQKRATLRPETIQRMRDGTPISLAERQATATQVQRLMRDRAFYQRLLEGGVPENDLWAELHITLGTPVQEAS